MTEQEHEQANKDLTEWMGECVHDWEQVERPWSGELKLTFTVCKKCKANWNQIEDRIGITNFFTHEGFFRLWNRAKARPEWEEFKQEKINEAFNDFSSEEGIIHTVATRFIDLIGPAFPEEWWRFLKEKEGK